MPLPVQGRPALVSLTALIMRAFNRPMWQSVAENRIKHKLRCCICRCGQLTSCYMPSMLVMEVWASPGDLQQAGLCSLASCSCWQGPPYMHRHGPSLPNQCCSCAWHARPILLCLACNTDGHHVEVLSIPGNSLYSDVVDCHCSLNVSPVFTWPGLKGRLQSLTPIVLP